MRRAYSMATCLLAIALLGAPSPALGLERTPELITVTPPPRAGSGFGPFLAVSRDGARVFTYGPLRQPETAGNDGTFGIYEVYRGRTTLQSVGSRGAGTYPSFSAISNDGRVLAWESRSQITAGDADGSARDVFARTAGGSTVDISRPPDGGHLTNDEASINAGYAGMSTDGRRIFFTSPERLTSADHDNSTDLYEYSNGHPTLLTPAGSGRTSIEFAGASSDGSRVFFVTVERLTADDTDDSLDLYERVAGHTVLLSTGNGAFDVAQTFLGPHYGYADVTPDGRHVVFATQERLTPDDQDDYVDLYQSDDGHLRRISTGPRGGNGPFDAINSYRSDAFFFGLSDDGRHSLFSTAEPLTADDNDAHNDLFDRVATTTHLISAGPPAGQVAPTGSYQGAAIARDGRRVIFESYEQLTSGDHDRRLDIYENHEGRLRLISHGPLGGNADKVPGKTACSGQADALFFRLFPDVNRTFFTTPERLIAADHEPGCSSYEDLGGKLSLLTMRVNGRSRTFRDDPVGTSKDGRTIYAQTASRWVRADRDSTVDIYALRLFSSPKAHLPRGAAHVDHRGFVAVRLTCPRASDPCRGRASLTARSGRALASASFDVGAGHSRLTRLRLSRSAQRTVRHRSLRVTLIALVNGETTRLGRLVLAAGR